MTQKITFPEGFSWGVATSAYQIEGAWNEEGRGPSIWDTFSHTPGKVFNGDTGDRAVDHFHRWEEDLKILKDLGVKTYRLSISWPRMLPNGISPINPSSFDFYDRIIDRLLEYGIDPMVNLFHYDLPQALQDFGGWTIRDTAYRFADYAQITARHFSDRVKNWITLNEPFVAAMNGHLFGDHAPGLKDIQAAVYATHHLLLAHGLGISAIHESARRPVRVGITLNLTPVYPANDTPEDRQAVEFADALINQTTLSPIFQAQYPSSVMNLIGLLLPSGAADDLKAISTPIDFLGANYYSRAVIKADPNVPFVGFTYITPENKPHTQMWEIYPSGISDLLKQITQRYAPKEIIITENGMPDTQDVDLDGQVRDFRRIQYLQDHLIQVAEAIHAGVPISGYHVWTLLDNFEWALGYKPRFGLVHVDFSTLKRTPKVSYDWFKRVIQQNGFFPQMHFLENPQECTAE